MGLVPTTFQCRGYDLLCLLPPIFTSNQLKELFEVLWSTTDNYLSPLSTIYNLVSSQLPLMLSSPHSSTDFNETRTHWSLNVRYMSCLEGWGQRSFRSRWWQLCEYLKNKKFSFRKWCGTTFLKFYHHVPYVVFHGSCAQLLKVKRSKRGIIYDVVLLCTSKCDSYKTLCIESNLEWLPAGPKNLAQRSSKGHSRP